MKFIINVDYGGFGIDEKVLKNFGITDAYGDEDDLRTNEHLIAYIENGEDINGYCADLAVVEIPDEATDYMIHEYDGWETLYYVLDGKIHVA